MSRSYCERCKRPQSVCLCDAISKQSNQIPVLILRHPDELSKALNTVPLLELGLDNVQVWDGTSFDLDKLRVWQREMNVYSPRLLFPYPLGCEDLHESLDDSDSQICSVKCDALIVLDGTWRNARELILCNSWLKELPTLAINMSEASQYRIRKAQHESSLSTIEAVGFSLERLDLGFDLERLLKPFKKMIDVQIQHMGQETYEKNYC